MTMSDRDGVIWQDGELKPWRDAQTHVLTHTLHYGVGVFEGIRAYNTAKGPAIFRLQEHVNRLFNSARIMGMKMPFDKETITKACLSAVSENHLESAYIRPICFYGAEGMGIRADTLKTHVAIAAWKWDAYLGADGLEKGITTLVSSHTRHHVNISMCKAKAVNNYANSVLALREAINAGAKEAILLDPEGYVAEGTGENIFIVRDGIIYTPETTSALEGITRDTIMKLAAEIGMPVREKHMTRDELYIADEIFFTGTAAEVTPVCEVDHHVVGEGKRGPITARLQSLYFDEVYGRSKKHPEWLSYVEG